MFYKNIDRKYYKYSKPEILSWINFYAGRHRHTRNNSIVNTTIKYRHCAQEHGRGVVLGI